VTTAHRLSRVIHNEHCASPRFLRRSLCRWRNRRFVSAGCLARRAPKAIVESTRLALRAGLDRTLRMHRNRRIPNLAIARSGSRKGDVTKASACALGPPARPERLLEHSIFRRKSSRHRTHRNLRDACHDCELHRGRPKGRPHSRTPLSAVCSLGVVRNHTQLRPLASELGAVTVRDTFAGAGGLEPTTCGFGIRCSTS
jgi:hypothetical protein